MYLSHFGLSERPFNDQMGSDFFFEGGNRGTTLDALIYLLTHGEGVEGIVEVTGEDGSGKSTLCRLLPQRLPASMMLIEFAQGCLPREELLRSLAEKLDFDSSQSRAIAAADTDGIGEPQNEVDDELQRVLTGMRAAGAQIVLLMDEAHDLPEETLDALCTLYDLQSSYHKSFQIVLFGEPRLDERLALPKMSKIRARVAHHFTLQPFTAKVVEAYLAWRLGAAGYRGTEMFSRSAIRSMTMASCGHIRQLDLLAANSLRIAYAAQSQVVDASHAKEAIRGVGTKRGFNWRSWRLVQDLPDRRIAGAGALFSVTPLAVVALLSWSIWQSPATSNPASIAPAPFEVAASAPLLGPVPSSTNPSTFASVISSAPPSAAAAVASSNAPAAVVPSNSPAEPKAHVPVPPVPHNSPVPAVQHGSTASIGGVKLAGYELLEQRVEATIKTVGATNRDTYTIQLFATENVQPDRMERFLARARSLVDLSDLYVHPVINGDRAKFRVTYGIYSSRDQASAAVGVLPEKYQTSFQPEIYALSEIH